MDTPTHKRSFSILSPPVDSETHAEKKTRHGPVSTSIEVLQNSTASASSMTSDMTSDIPHWAKTLLEQVNKTHDIVASMEIRFKNLETLANQAKTEAADAKKLVAHALDIASASKDLSKECRDHTADLEKQVEKVENDNLELRRQIQQQNDYSRRDNLILEGLDDNQDETNEDLEANVRSFIKNTLRIGDGEVIRFDRCHRLGRYNPKRKRGVIIRFNWYADRMSVWTSRRNLKGSKFFLKEDYCPATKEARDTLYPYLQAALSAGERATQLGDKLLLNGTKYSVDDISYLDTILSSQDGESEWRKQGRRRHWKNKSHPGTQPVGVHNVPVPVNPGTQPGGVHNVPVPINPGTQQPDDNIADVLNASDMDSETVQDTMETTNEP
jgi:hypothetical protein